MTVEHHERSSFALLGRFLDGCATLDRDVEALLHAGWNTSSKRQAISLGFCRAAFEHAGSQRLLIEAGHTGTVLRCHECLSETARRRLRMLVKLLPKGQKKLVYTDLEDKVEEGNPANRRDIEILVEEGCTVAGPGSLC